MRTAKQVYCCASRACRACCTYPVELPALAAIKAHDKEASRNQERTTHVKDALNSTTAWLLAALVAVCIPPAAAHEGKLTFAPILAKATPAVVNIQVTGERTVRHPFFNDPSFRRFFPDRRVSGAGAGVIIDAGEGHIVTNHHVIEDADEITVTLQDRRQFEAELLGSDPGTDIALLKIDAEDLQALPLGDSDALAVGDFVIAIGNPYGFDHTVTSGIVSALGRRGFSDGYEDFIQTDAAINRGNSGGALVDLDGDLIGINSQIISPSGGHVGLGFAVPSNFVKIIAAQLLEFGEARRGQLGVLIGDVRPGDTEALGLDTAAGVIVSEVMEDSAAEDAGVEPGDVIVSLNGEDIEDANDLRARVGVAQVGKVVELGIVRDGKEQTLQATIGSMSRAGAATFESSLLAGAKLRNLSREHELYGSVSGVEIVDVRPQSVAFRVGLRAGDVILRANRRNVENAAELEEVLDGAEVAALQVQRGDRRMFFVVR